MGRTDLTGRVSIAGVLGLLIVTPALAAGKPMWNAALRKYGARVSASAPATTHKDIHTTPGDTFDGNVHTRCVFTGTPYTFTLQLPQKTMIDHISFADDDYTTESAAKDVEISLDGGAPIRQTLQLMRPVRNRPSWQDVPVSQQVNVIKITVLSNYPGQVNWGGIGEIELLTPDNLDTRMAVPDYDPKAPTFVHVPPLVYGTGIKVQMPPLAKAGQHPCLLMTPAELASLKKTLADTDRGKTSLATLLGVANAAVAAPVIFPDPKGPLAQVKDRGDKVAQEHDTLSKNAGSLGIAYALTGDRKYAEKAREILVGYAQRYALYPEHQGVNHDDTGKVMGQRLSEAMWLIPLAEAYDYTYDSGVLTDQDKSNIENNILKAAVAFIRRKDPAAEVADRDRQNPDWRTAMPAPGKGHVGNWLNFYNTATIMVGAETGDKDMVDLAAADFRMLIAQGVGDDGMWNEGAIGYQMFALMAMVPGMEVAARQGIDLWGFDHCRVKMLFDSPLRYAYPDGTAPGIGDSTRAQLGNWSTMDYDYAYLRYQDPRYAVLINETPRQLQMSEALYFPTRIYAPLPVDSSAGAPGAYPSTVFTNLGYAIMRSPETYALLDYGPFAGVHGHLDKLNLILYCAGPDGKGDEMGGEPRFHRYENPLHDEWTRETIAHNTMTVDEQGQLPADGRLVLFESTPDLQVMRAQSTAAYPGVLLDRTVVVAPGMVLDLYQGRSATDHIWDRTLRYNGVLQQLNGAAGTAALGANDGYQHLKLVARIPAENTWSGAWKTSVGTFQTLVAGAPGQQVMLAVGPDKDQMALVRQQGKSAGVAAAYSLETWPNPVQSVAWQPSAGPAATGVVAVQKDGARTEVLVAKDGPAGKGTWQADGWETDARVLVVRKQGPVTTLLVCGGTFADDGHARLSGAAPGNYLGRLHDGKMDLVSFWPPAPPV